MKDADLEYSEKTRFFDEEGEYIDMLADDIVDTLRMVNERYRGEFTEDQIFKIVEMAIRINNATDINDRLTDISGQICCLN